MNETIARPPEPDFSTITTEQLITYREAENRVRSSIEARAILGEPDPDAIIEWRNIALPGRDLPVRVYRPVSAHVDASLPLIVHVHGGAFVGTATQCDWNSSLLAARLPAVVVSVEHRLIAPDSPIPNAAADGWDVLEHVMQDAAEWGIDPARTAVLGESFGGLISALTAIRARDTGLRLKAQVLVNPAVDMTETMHDYPSIVEYGYSPTRAAPLLRYLERIAVPAGVDARAFSPRYADDLSELAPALVVVPTRDAIADHGRDYAERLRAAGTSVQLTEYPGAPHGFLSMPGLEPQAVDAHVEILDFLREALAP